MIYRRIIYFGIFYLCKIKRENGGWKIEEILFIGKYIINFFWVYFRVFDVVYVLFFFI